MKVEIDLSNYRTTSERKAAKRVDTTLFLRE